MANLSTYININANNVTATNLSATGNVSSSSELSTTGNVSGNYILGNGSQLTGLPATYSDSNVTSLLSNLGSNAISGTGNITTTGNISADYVVLSGGLVSSGASPAPSISGFSTISAIGNITGNYFIGNGSQLTGIASSYGNSDVATFLADYGSNTISTTGNISAGNVSLDGNLTVNGSPIYGVPASFAKYTRTTTQTGIVANTVIVCDVQENSSGSDISVNTSTGNVTLTAGRTYRVRGTVGSMVNNGNPVSGAWQWRNVTGNAYIGSSGSTIAPAASNYNTGASQIAEAVFTPAVTTVLQLTVTTISNGSVISTPAATNEGGAAWIDIEVIGGQAPITAFSTTGNVTGNYFIGNGSQLTGVASSLSGNLAGNLEGNGFGANAFSFVSVTGNVTASNFIGNISITGNVTGTSANVSLVAGSYTMTFDNTGVLTLPAVGGGEGGEINFGAPTANTTLIGPVKVDVYQDRIRFFDGSAKGVYIDLSQAGASVSTLLNNRVCGLVNAGTFVTMDLIKATVTTTGNRGLSLATTTGTFTYNIGGNFGMSGNGSGGQSFAGQTLTTTATASIFGWGFTSTGDTSTYVLTDTTNSRCYRITLMIGASFNNNSIVIERLI